MKQHEIKKISRIVDELFTYFMMRGSSGAMVRVMLEPEGFRVKCLFRKVRLPAGELATLRKKLGVARNPELEEYYWQLAGEADSGNELVLVAMMTDRISLRQDRDGLRVEILRLDAPAG